MAVTDFEHSGFFVLRTPLLPFEELLEWSAGLEASAGSGSNLKEAWARDMRLLRQRLHRLLSRPEIREAIFVAAPELEARARPWWDGNDGATPDDLVMALGRYFVRMAGRSTPFGLFAGNAVGRIGDVCRLHLAERGRYRRHTRLDMDYLSALVRALDADAGLRRELTYRPNSSLYEAAGRARYAEAHLADRGRSYQLVALELDEPLREVLGRAGAGATHAELEEMLAHDGITREEAAAYVDELIDAQVLTSDLEPPVTGREALPEVVERLETTVSGRGAAAVLGEVERELAALDEQSLGAEPERYRQLAAKLASLPAPVALARLFQVDLVKPVAEVSLPASILDDVGQGLEVLLRLHADVLGRENELFATFRQQFTERYGEREVPLLEALDEEVGVGFQASTGPNAEASPLLDPLIFPPKAPDPGRPWSRAHAFILPRLVQALASQAREIVLERRDLEELPPADSSRVPDAFAVMCKLLAARAEDLRSGDYQVVLHGISGPSGARFLGRFCPMDRELSDHVCSHLQREEALLPEAVFAEIVHLPEGRMGNILARPLLRGHEIPFLGRSGAPPERQVLLQDLRVSVSGKRVILRSARLGREVVPRLTTAHNFMRRTVRAYQFLCRLQSQYCTEGLTWNWGPLEHLPFLPAIRYGRVVLAPAVWSLDRREIRSLAEKTGAEGFAQVQQLRAERRMPRFVGLADADNVLPIDLDNALSVATLVDLVARRNSCVLREIEGSVEQLPVTGREGHFVHEIVLPLVRRSPATSTEARARSGPQPRAAQADAPRLGPGTAWVYWKLYTGTATAEGLLRDELPALLQWGRDTGAMDRWFFVRYNDPGFHLRIRIRSSSSEARRDLISQAEKVCSELMSRGLIWKLQLDTYDPEIARYGGALGLDLAERVFHADSEATLNILSLIRHDGAADHRWRLCLAGMDRLLDDLGFELESKHQVLVAAATDFGREFQVEGAFKRRIRDRYRTVRPALERLLQAGNGTDPALDAGLAILGRRSQALLPVVGGLKTAEREGALQQPLPLLAKHYMHMHANRMFRAAARAHETVIYHFLERLYDSRLARLRQGAAVGRT